MLQSEDEKLIPQKCQFVDLEKKEGQSSKGILEILDSMKRDSNVLISIWNFLSKEFSNQIVK